MEVVEVVELTAPDYLEGLDKAEAPKEIREVPDQDKLLPLIRAEAAELLDTVPTRQAEQAAVVSLLFYQLLLYLVTKIISIYFEI